jgi:hypothetical protein
MASSTGRFSDCMRCTKYLDYAKINLDGGVITESRISKQYEDHYKGHPKLNKFNNENSKKGNSLPFF